MNLEQVKNQVNNALKLHRENNIKELQQQLYELYLNFNKSGGGRLIINYPQKDKLAECFTLMLLFDWMKDDDIREVWAENGFYCLIEYIDSVQSDEKRVVGGFILLYRHMYYSSKNLAPKISDILTKAKLQYRSPFDNDDYINGVGYVMHQFMFVAAQILNSIEAARNVLSSNERKMLDEVLNLAKTKPFKNMSPDVIFEKARFIKRIIGSILEDL